MTGTKILWGQMTLSLTAVLAGVWGATEWTALRLGFQPALESPWFRPPVSRLRAISVLHPGGTTSTPMRLAFS